MYVLPKILNLDDMFARTSNTTVFNELMFDHTPEQIIDILCDVSNDKTDTVATCDCDDGLGKVGNYYEGMVCPRCKSVCTASLFSIIKNDTWLEIPKSIKKVLHPHVYTMLSKWAGKNSKNLLHMDTILDLKAELDPKISPHILGQGFNYFYDNFDSIINYFAHIHAKKDVTPVMLKFLQDNSANLWCTKLPTISKILQPVTKANDFVRYVDTDIKNLIKAILNLNGVLLSEKMMKFSVDHVERNFFPVYSAFISYVQSISANKLAKKPSLLRKHIFGARMDCTGRSVAIPIVVNHECEDVYLPWKLGISIYKYHILSMLVNRYNYKEADAYNKISEAMNIYDHEIDIIMQTLIAECPYKGLPILMNRNPSLKIAAIQKLYVTKIKPCMTKVPTPVLDDDVDINNVKIAGDKVILPESTKLNERVIRAIEDDTIEGLPLIINGQEMVPLASNCQ